MTRVVFMGTPEFSVPILEGLLAQNYEVVAVVTQPDRPVGRKKVLTAPPVKIAAVAHGLEVLQPEKISGSVEMLRVMEFEPDIIVTAAFGQFLPEKLIQSAKHGVINVHASLLPKYRGGAPVHYAIINGEKETGVTIMQTIKKMDAGAIYLQRAIPITDKDDVGEMFKKLSILGKELLLEALPDILSGRLQATPQNEAEVSFSPNIKREEEAIDWQKNAGQIDCQVRGMRPFPGAFTMYQGKRMKLWDVAVVLEKTEAKPGTIVAIHKKDFWIAAGNQTIVQINQLQPAGKGKLSAVDFLNGIGKEMSIGDKVE
ncbi:methionyl-tRNA formyltransferase [Vagococcus entomophilus]|uniref:Methionyl-tRNA formyltransferase n=1 Tax=Vagococcus entomophilus TaxID=1160095 RepID=A0A430AFS1_9ENTE|nr:methionyl-tRNA formyltransferase [Vagococcus entomophilus]RSU06590.1 methionyl-tRNA formyltransferase [Vagococcus entomophilus]